MASNNLSAARLRTVLHYDPETGIFTRRVNVGPVKVGDVAGSLHHKGYSFISIDGTVYASHRLAWLYVYGAWPVNEIDHINAVKNDNRIQNLRDVSHSGNQQNTATRADNSSGFKGVSFHKSAQHWRARITVQGRQIHIGYFDTPEAAGLAAQSARKQLHPFTRQEDVCQPKNRQ